MARVLPFRFVMIPLTLIAAAPALGQILEQVVVTATQEDASHLELPLSASVISSEDLEVVRHVHVSQAFQRVPGAWISRGNGQESLTALRSPVLTGPGSCGAFFMGSDGVALRAPGFCNVNQLFRAVWLRRHARGYQYTDPAPHRGTVPRGVI